MAWASSVCEGVDTRSITVWVAPRCPLEQGVGFNIAELQARIAALNFVILHRAPQVFSSSLEIPDIVKSLN
jgi:hypothetical protein